MRLKSKEKKVRGITGWIMYLDKIYRTRFDYPGRYHNLSMAKDKIQALIYSIIGGMFLYGMLLFIIFLPMIRKFRRLKSTSYYMNIIISGLLTGLFITNFIYVYYLSSREMIEKLYLIIKKHNANFMKPVLYSQAYIYDHRENIIIYQLILIFVVLIGYYFRNAKSKEVK